MKNSNEKMTGILADDVLFSAVFIFSSIKPFASNVTNGECVAVGTDSCCLSAQLIYKRPIEL